jgi:hypothetical protein
MISQGIDRLIDQIMHDLSDDQLAEQIAHRISIRTYTVVYDELYFFDSRIHDNIESLVPEPAVRSNDDP